MRENELPPARHEASDVGIRLIFIGVPAVLLVVLLLSWLVLKLYAGGTTDRSVQLPLPHFPAPELQSDPARDLERLRAAQLQQLNGSGWLDAQHQRAHIPVEEAMRQLAGQGIPDWPRPGEAADAR